MSSEKTVILTVGLPPHHRATVHKADPKLLEMVESQLKALPGQLADAGIEAKNVFMGPEDGIDKWKEELQRHPKLQGVVIGGGIRTANSMVAWMEQLIEGVRTDAPHAKIIFNTSPGDTVEAIQRWFK